MNLLMGFFDGVLNFFNFIIGLSIRIELGLFGNLYFGVIEVIVGVLFLVYWKVKVVLDILFC